MGHPVRLFYYGELTVDKKYELATCNMPIPSGDSLYRVGILYNISIPISRSMYRIKALRSFGCIKEGALGGYIESEDNLSHEGYCWVFSSAQVYGNARVDDNARVYGSVRLSGNVHICDNAQIFGDAHICPSYAFICGDTKIDHGVWVQGVLIGDKRYLVSNTLEKILLGAN